MVVQDSDEWPEESIDKFREFALSEEDFSALVNTSAPFDGFYSILMFLGGSDNSYSVNERLVQLKLASSDVFSAIVSASAGEGLVLFRLLYSILLTNALVLLKICWIEIYPTGTLWRRISTRRRIRSS